MDDASIENSEDMMSKKLNQYFLSVFTENLTTLSYADQVFRGRKDEKLTNINITSQQVIEGIDKLRIDKSLEVDELFSLVLKEHKDIISVALTDISNRSVASETYLDFGDRPT